MEVCPIYIRAKTGQKARLVISLTSDISCLPAHGKIVLTFEEMLVCDGGNPVYAKWKTEEWFPYASPGDI